MNNDVQVEQLMREFGVKRRKKPEALTKAEMRDMIATTRKVYESMSAAILDTSTVEIVRVLLQMKLLAEMGLSEVGVDYKTVYDRVLFAMLCDDPNTHLLEDLLKEQGWEGE